MKQLTKMAFKKICNRAHFDFNEDLYQHLKQEWKSLIASLDALKAINVDHVEPFTRINPPIKFNDLRDDLVQNSLYLDQKMLVKNAKTTDQSFITIKRMF